jgi:hypothetical protein
VSTINMLSSELNVFSSQTLVDDLKTVMTSRTASEEAGGGERVEAGYKRNTTLAMEPTLSLNVYWVLWAWLGNFRNSSVHMYCPVF